jgi:hypothetical protein
MLHVFVCNFMCTILLTCNVSHILLLCETKFAGLKNYCIVNNSFRFTN